MNPSANAASLREIENITGIRIPDGVTVVQFDRQTESDDLLRAKLTMSPGQWDDLLRRLSLDANDFQDDQRYLLGANTDWWNPQDSPQLPTIQVQLPVAKVLDLGVDQSAPERLLVFLVWHGT